MPAAKPSRALAKTNVVVVLPGMTASCRTLVRRNSHTSVSITVIGVGFDVYLKTALLSPEIRAEVDFCPVVTMTAH